MVEGLHGARRLRVPPTDRCSLRDSGFACHRRAVGGKLGKIVLVAWSPPRPPIASSARARPAR